MQKNFASNLTGENIVTGVHTNMLVASAEEQITPCSVAIKNQIREKVGSNLNRVSNRNSDHLNLGKQVQQTQSDISALPTPVSWKKLQFLLDGYDKDIAMSLVEGFKNGFSIYFFR